MTRRQVLEAGTLVWVVAGAAVALGSLGDVNDNARLLVGMASVLGPLLGVGAAIQLGRHNDRSAGVLLLLSALLTPSYFAYVINIPALVIGGILAVASPRVLPDFHARSGHRPAEGLGT